MKKTLQILPLIVFCSFLSANVYADQLAYITKLQAEKAVRFLKDNKVNEVILWCACCENYNPTPMKRVHNTKYFFRYTGTEKYYEVVITGQNEDGSLFNEPVDLAYVFVHSGTKAKCLGLLLNFKCDPCTVPFDWQSYKNNKSSPEIVYDIQLNPSRAHLLGKWQDENSVFSFYNNKMVSINWNDGGSATGRWVLNGSVLSLDFSSAGSRDTAAYNTNTYRGKDDYIIISLTNKKMKYQNISRNEKTIYNATKVQ